MTDLTSQIQSIEQKLQGLGLLDAAHVDGVADQAFIDARDMAVRFMAAVLEMEDVQGYTQEVGQQILAKITELETAGELDSTRQTIIDNADVNIVDGWGFAANTIRGYLRDAGIPEERWGDIHLTGLIPLLDEREQIVADLSAISEDDGVQEIQVAQEEAVQSAVEIVLATIDQEGQAWAGGQTQAALMQYVIQLQADFGFADDQRYGAFSPEFAAHLEARLASGDPLPANYDGVDLQAFSTALTTLRTQGQYIPPAAPMNLADATALVEDFLMRTAPQLNSQLEAAEAQTGELGGLLAMFSGILQNSLLGQRIPEIAEVDGIFDLRSQASLQGLMMVLGDPMLLNFAEDGRWIYTPQKGEIIQNRLRERLTELAPMIGEETVAEINGQLTDERLADLVEALNVLHAQGRISQELFIDPNNNAVEMPDLVQRLYQDLIDEYKDTNPDMLRLLDTMTAEYNGVFGMQAIMPDLEIPDLFSDIDGSLTCEQRLAQFYLEARRNYQGSQAEFDADLVIVLNTVVATPFGTGPYREGYMDQVQDAIYRAGQAYAGDPEAAAQALATDMAVIRQRLVEQHGAVTYTPFWARDLTVWKPGLQDLEITAGGEIFTAEMMAGIYDDVQFSFADESYQRRGLSEPVTQHSAVLFRDDAGQVYVMAVDRDSMIFSVEPIDVEALQAIMSQEISMNERREQMRAADDGYAMIDQVRNGVGNIIVNKSPGDLLEYLTSDRVPTLQDMSVLYEGTAADIRDGVQAEQGEAAARDPVPFIADEVAGDENPRPTTREEAMANPQPVEQFTDHEIARMEQLRSLAAHTLYEEPRIINSNQLALLREHAGRPLSIGAGYGSSLHIARVSVPPEDYQGPVVAWFDQQTNSVRAIAVPNYLRDAGARADIREIASLTNMDSQEFLRQMEVYPELMGMAHSHARKVFGPLEPRLDGDPLSFEDMRSLKRSIQRILEVTSGAVGAAPMAPERVSQATPEAQDPSIIGAFERTGAAVERTLAGLGETWDAAAPAPDRAAEMRAAAEEITGRPENGARVAEASPEAVPGVDTTLES